MQTGESYLISMIRINWFVHKRKETFRFSLQAFAELQTGASDLKMVTDNSRIPFHNKTEFYVRILFRNAALYRGLLRNRQCLDRFRLFCFNFMCLKIR